MNETENRPPLDPVMIEDAGDDEIVAAMEECKKPVGRPPLWNLKDMHVGEQKFFPGPELPTLHRAYGAACKLQQRNPGEYAFTGKPGDGGIWIKRYLRPKDERARKQARAEIARETVAALDSMAVGDCRLFPDATKIKDSIAYWAMKNYEAKHEGRFKFFAQARHDGVWIEKVADGPHTIVSTLYPDRGDHRY